MATKKVITAKQMAKNMSYCVNIQQIMCNLPNEVMTFTPIICINCIQGKLTSKLLMEKMKENNAKQNIIYHNKILSEIVITSQDNEFTHAKFKSWAFELYALKINTIDKYFIVPGDMNYAEVFKFLKKETGLKDITLSIYSKPLLPTDEMKAVLKKNTMNVLVSEHAKVKMEKEISSNEGIIYLIQTREFKDTDIYKIGKTKNSLSERLGNYGKGGHVIFTLRCNKELDEMEQKLIKIFIVTFLQKNEIGNEYFQGDEKAMIKIIYDNIMDTN